MNIIIQMQSLPDPNPKPPHPQLLSSGIKIPLLSKKKKFSNYYSNS